MADYRENYLLFTELLTFPLAKRRGAPVLFMRGAIMTGMSALRFSPRALEDCLPRRSAA
jgi:hypothetical protein